ncbi:uncharacterized protein BX664DRAFT_337093 [Halteromyces radiatus]|uniref:uncharacterized protein n=1 Tax=Halteromyces radiatus TaxID=101107 RepID=UPI00221E4FDD|nr:uncharacterized protein BX664DRAFT_337093 [Halteromyces radiatus]KAI8084483.1 hypothetical protein BX664DRAFT_337093 [Halteromyces radiatus]
MKLHIFLFFFLTWMTLLTISHALSIDKRGEDENEPDEDEPDENEGGPVKVKTVIEYLPTTPAVAPSRPHHDPPSSHPTYAHDSHSQKTEHKQEPKKPKVDQPKKYQPKMEEPTPTISIDEAKPTIPSITSAAILPTSLTESIIIPTSWTLSATVASSMAPTPTATPESTDLPPLGIASSASSFKFNTSWIVIFSLLFSIWCLH